MMMLGVSMNKTGELKLNDKNKLPDYAWRFVEHWEGGSKITNNPLDRGGVTKYGVSQKAYPFLNIAALTQQQAADIYYRDYWLKSSCENLKPFMRLMVFNAAVNMGAVASKKLLQKTIGLKGDDIDGIVGGQTLAAISAYKSSPSTFVTWYATNQVLRYLNIIDRRRSQEVFKKGWIRRTFDAVFKTGQNVTPN